MLTIEAQELIRLMQCNGSFKLPVFELPHAPSSVREQGVAAHFIARSVWTREFSEAIELVDRRAPNGIFITPEMADHVAEYIDIVRASDAPEFNDVDVKTALTDDQQFYSINGHADNIALGPHHVTVRQFQYGFSIVEPDENWSMIFHAIAFCVKMGRFPANVTFEVFQPRAYHHRGRLRRWSISGDELRNYWMQMHQTLCSLSDHLQTGPACGKCKSFVFCPIRREKDFNAIEAAGLAYADDLPNDALAVLLDTVEAAKKTLDETQKALQELARHRVKNGQVVANYGFEPTLGNTTWNEGVTPETLLALTGKNLTKPGLVTPAAAKRAGAPEAIVDALTHRPVTGHKLVRENTHKKAARLLGLKT